MKSKSLVVGVLATVAIIGSGAYIAQNDIITQFAAVSASQSNSPVFCYSFTRDIKRGDSDQEVFTLNKALISLGRLSGTPVRTFTADTERAVIAFQQEKGISPATGFVGNRTRTALNALFACTTPANKPTVQLFYPNGGEQWKIGESKTVVWRTYNFANNSAINVDVFLKFPTSGELCFLGNGPAASNGIRVTLDRTTSCGGSAQRTITPGSYEMYVRANTKSYKAIGAGETLSYDFSDKPFTIVAENPTTDNKIEGFRFVSAFSGGTNFNIAKTATTYTYNLTTTNPQIAFITDVGTKVTSVKYAVTAASGKQCSLAGTTRTEITRPFTLGGNTGNTYVVWKPKANDVCAIAITTYGQGNTQIESKKLEVTFKKNY